MKEDNNRQLITTVIILLIITALISVAAILLYRVRPEIIQGRIESEQVTVSGKLIGRVMELYVKEGERVKSGDTLVWINSPEAIAQLTTASAMENVAKYQNRKVDSGAREEILKSLKQALDASQANLDLAQKSLERTKALYLDSIVTQQRFDEVTALCKNAEAARNAALYQYEMALAGAQREDRESARALVNAASGGVMAIEALLDDSKLTSPTDGEVAAIYPRPGELIMPGTPIMDIIKSNSGYAILNIRETELYHFTVGERFTATIPALENKQCEFEVYYVNPLGSYANSHSSRATGSYDIVTFQIKARPLSDALREELRAGMSILIEL